MKKQNEFITLVFYMPKRFDYVLSSFIVTSIITRTCCVKSAAELTESLLKRVKKSSGGTRDKWHLFYDMDK